MLRTLHQCWSFLYYHFSSGLTLSQVSDSLSIHRKTLVWFWVLLLSLSQTFSVVYHSLSVLCSVFCSTFHSCQSVCTSAIPSISSWSASFPPQSSRGVFSTGLVSLYFWVCILPFLVSFTYVLKITPGLFYI